MAQPVPRRLIAMLAAMSATGNFSVGCYCADASRCHRSILGELLMDAGALMLHDDPRDDAATAVGPAGDLPR